MPVSLNLMPSRDHQAHPSDGVLSRGLNLSLDELRSRVARGGTGARRIYSYIAPSIKIQGTPPLLCQKGTGPNFQGGVVTLCTCKHKMRAHLAPSDWPGCWIAGLTSRTNSSKRHWLSYLMRVDAAFESHYDLWQWLPAAVRAAKCASVHQFGDLYEPRQSMPPPLAQSRFSADSYRPPVPEHSHAGGGWRTDIEYEGVCRRPSLLTADPAKTFIWSVPMIFSRIAGGKHPRGEKRYRDLHELLNSFSPRPE